MPRTKNTSLATINWTSDSNTLIWKLLAQLAKKENHAALYGIQKGNKTIGSSKAKIHKEIASVLFPESYEGNEDTLGSRVKGKIEDLYSRYKREVKRLTVTGGGLGGNDDAQSQMQSQEEHLTCYVPADGPDETTTSEARNLWEKILQGFPFFAEMHRFLCSRPNAIPPVVTTGVGPAGRHVVHFQDVEDRGGTAGDTFSQPSDYPFEPQVAIPATPARLNSMQASVDKENIQPPPSTGRKRSTSAKNSSFTVTEATIEKAKASIHRVTKKSFKDRLADATEASLKSADARAAAALRMDKKRLILEQLAQVDKKRDQVIELLRLKVYSEQVAKRKLNELEECEEEIRHPAKRPRARSPSLTSSIHQSSPIASSSIRYSSPNWDITQGLSLPSEDTIL